MPKDRLKRATPDTSAFLERERSLEEYREKLAKFSPEALLEEVTKAAAARHAVVAKSIEYLAEIDRRKLHLKIGYASLFDFCTHRLKLSEKHAFLRIAAARIVRRFPCALGRIARGELDLSKLVLLRDHLTEANHEELFDAAAGQTTRTLEEMLSTMTEKTSEHPLSAEAPRLVIETKVLS